MFNAGIDSILVHYTVAVEQTGNKKAKLKDIDYDTGKPTALNEYKLTDDTYKQWLESLQKQNFVNADDKLKFNIAHFYGKADTTGISKFVPPDQASK